MANSTENKHPLAGKEQINFVNFPADEYIPASIISYTCADLPPSKFSETNDPVPSVRFLFAGYITNDQGEKVVARKWTEWLRISYNEKAKLPKMFNGFSNLAQLMQSDDLFKTPMKILLEANDQGYTKIIRVKPCDDDSTQELVYDQNYVPYKYVKAFGNLVYQTLAVIKCGEGIKTFHPEDMVEPETENRNDK